MLIPRSKVPKDRHVIQSKTIFTKKKNETGKVIRHKVRVVARGDKQKAGVDYKETFAPVMRLESVRAILHIGAAEDWDINHIDVKMAFLHGELEEEIYMEQPDGMAGLGKENWVCRLSKSLYGLKQAGRHWNQKMHEDMTKEGWECVAVEHSVYVK
jgi:hypothetical protein